MNVMFYGSCYPPTPYGASRYVDNLTRALAAKGHGVSVVTHSETGLASEGARDGITVYRIGGRQELQGRDAARKALAIAAARRSDIIQGVDYLGECAALIREADRPPICIKVSSSISMRALRRSLGHGAWNSLMVELAALRAWRQWRNERVCLREADLLFAPSHRAFYELARQRIRVPARHAVIPNPVSIPESWTNAESTDPLLLYVGRLDFGKGVASLPGILRAVRDVYPATQLVLAGGDHYARGIGSVAQWLKKRFGQDVEHTIFAGALDQAALDAWFVKAWVVLIPSRWDSCPNAMLEAMARGKPLVASPHGGMPELVEGCGTTIAAPDGSAFVNGVLELLSDTGLRQRQSRRLVNRALACYKPDRVVDQYIRFLQAGLLDLRENGKT